MLYLKQTHRQTCLATTFFTGEVYLAS